MGGGTLHGAFEGTQGGSHSIPKNRERLYGKPGKINGTKGKKTKIGDDGRAIMERHFKDSSNPKAHSNPHDHIITWDEKGNPHFSKPINYPKGKAPKFK
jgi:hypothetical protein